MKKFLLQILLFSFLISLIVVTGVILPHTPRSEESLLFSKVSKDSLLQNVKSPRIIFVGGSNLSFGLNSQMIKDSLGLNPINTAIIATQGLIYMMDNVLRFIKPGDIVVVSAEYDHFFGEFAYGRGELLRSILDVNLSQLTMLRTQQWMNVAKYIPQYALSKLHPGEYTPFHDETDIYGAHAFNEYGDAVKHWNLKPIKFPADGPITEKFNHHIIDELYDFKQKLKEKGAVLFITFPGYQATSFEHNENQIMKVEAELQKKDFMFLGSPERYKMPDSVMFNTPYHLIKTAVDYRTNLLIEDLRKHIK